MLKPFVFIDIWFKKQNTYRKWLKTNICSFVWRVWKWKEKGQKYFWPSGAGIRTPDFLIFPPMIWIFIWFEDLRWDESAARKLNFNQMGPCPDKIYSEFIISEFWQTMFRCTHFKSPILWITTTYCSYRYINR